MKKLELTVHFRPWGSTFSLVHNEACTLAKLTRYANDLILDSGYDNKMDCLEIKKRMEDICDRVTSIPSLMQFRVEVKNECEVQVFYRYGYEKEYLWLVFQWVDGDAKIIHIKNGKFLNENDIAIPLL